MDEQKPRTECESASAAERWHRIKAVFLAAVERAEPERAEYLPGVCAGDDGVRRDVEALLASDAAAGSFAETPAARLPGPGGQEPPPHAGFSERGAEE